MRTPADSDGALRAALAPSFSPRRWRRYLETGGEPVALGRCGARVLGSRLGLGRSEASRLDRELRSVDPGSEREQADSAHVRIVTWGEPGYPVALRQLADPPPALYCRGHLIDADRYAVALIGSRRASAYGLRVARTLGADLARSGVTVVGGLARGVDAAAHEAALDAGGRTIAVLGSGMLNPYPPEHVDLLERVTRQGAVLSEFPLHAPPARLHFPQRNRIIAALAEGVVVVEAAQRSGALSTARHGLEQGRTVMAVPGPIDSESSRGTLEMLREGAAPVGSAPHIFEALGWCELGPVALPEGERKVLEALPECGATADDVAETTGMPEEVAAGYLVTLEVRGLVEREKGGTYCAL